MANFSTLTQNALGAPSRYRTGTSGYLDPIAGKAYPGSSNNWLTGPSPDYGLIQPSIPGYGQPGDAARKRMGVPTIDPTMAAGNQGLVGGNAPNANRLQQLEADYKAGKIPFSQLFEQYNLPSRYPEVSGATSKAFGDVAAVDKATGLPDFNALKTQFSNANSEMNSRYNEFQKGNDITGYAAGQRASDAAAAELTSDYAKTARGQLGDAADIISRYRTEGQGALDKNLANANDFYNKDIPASIKNAMEQATAYTSRYGISRGGGMGSDIGKIAGDSAVRAALPFQLQGRQYIGNALEKYQPFYGDVASRDFNRVANLNMPTEQNIYGAQVGDAMRSKSTEQHIQNLDMMVKERGLNAAIQNLKNQGLSQSIINSLIGEWQAQKSRSLGIAGQAAGLEQEYGGERGYNYLPGANVTQPQYFGLPSPAFPNNTPSRYTPNTPTPAAQQAGAAPADWRTESINRTMAYTKEHPASNPYGGQGGGPGAYIGSGDWQTGEQSGNYWN